MLHGDRAGHGVFTVKLPSRRRGHVFGRVSTSDQKLTFLLAVSCRTCGLVVVGWGRLQQAQWVNRPSVGDPGTPDLCLQYVFPWSTPVTFRKWREVPTCAEVSVMGVHGL